MVETEVESILREIRERVISEERAGQQALTSPAHGTGEAAQLAATSHSAPASHWDNGAEHLALINSYLATTARSWDRLPPVVSNRSGLSARLELWCKRQLKRATRWFTWEQVNFNAAVHHAVRDVLPVLAAYDTDLKTLRAKVSAGEAERRVAAERHQSDLAALRAEFAGLQTELATRRAEFAARNAELRAALQAQSDLTTAQSSQLKLQLTGLVNELRERDDSLRAEQRVSFKQLSLESGEAATLADRTRRKLESQVAELGRRIDEREKLSDK